MKINVFLEKENKNKKIVLDDKFSVQDLLKSLRVNPVTVVVAVNGDVVMEDYKLKDNDNVDVLSVVSGG